jgi:hypothetical protein
VAANVDENAKRADFDPYHKWLGIPPEEQPPTRYRLLGLHDFESDPEVILGAVMRQSAHLKTYQLGQHAALTQELLNEVSAAKVCLLDTQKKAAYDAELRQALQSREEASRFRVLPPAEPLRPAAGASAIQKLRGKKSPRLSAPRVAAIIAAVAAIVVSGLWIVFSRSDKPSEKVTAAATATRAGGPASGPGDSANGLSPPAKRPPSTSTASASIPVATGTKKKPTAAPPKTSGSLLSHAKTENAEGGPPAIPRPTPDGTTTTAAPRSAPKTDSPIAGEPASDSTSVEQSPPSAENKAAKLAPPPAERQDKLVAEIDEIYKSNEAKDPAARAALARKLFDDARNRSGSTDEQFVLFRRASELARDAGETDLAVEVVDAIADAGFDIQPLRVKARLLKRLIEQNVPGGAKLAAASAACIRVAEDAAAGDAADDAVDLLEAARKSFAESVRRAQAACLAARAASARVRDPAEATARAGKSAEAESGLAAAKAAQSAAADCLNDVQQTIRQREAVHAALEKLKTAPGDPAACLAIGRWRCFRQGAWDEGLKFLAKGSDETLKSAAAIDLAANSSKPEDCIARGDAWWDAAEKADGRERPAMRRRAHYWYVQALPDLTGLARGRIEKRIESLGSDASPETAAEQAGTTSAAASNATLTKTNRIGHDSGARFEEGNARDALVGLSASVKHIFGRDAISSIQGIYQSGRKQLPGPQHGKVNGKPVSIVARPGYAVAGIIAHGGDRLDGFRVVFMRIKGRGLDPSQTYESDWVGGQQGSVPIHLGCDGNPVVGLFGGAGDWVDGLGLVQLEPGPVGGQSRRQAVTIVSAEWGGGKKWADVTARVQELVDAGKDFWAKPGTLKSDPTPRWRKRLRIRYRLDDQEKSISINEDGKVDVQALKR